METRRPLEGIRVLELAQVVAGPFCGTLMAEFGAEVIKTEMPGKGDDLRRLGPSEDGVSYWFAVDNRNKKLMTLGRRTPKGQEIVRRLVPQCDVVLENFRPGVLEKWGLGWETLRALNPRLVMARITAFGQTGPLRQGPGYAAIASAFGGTWYVNGPADRPPARPTPVYPDYLTGLFTAFGLMAALRHRDATGERALVGRALLRQGHGRAARARHPAFADHEHGRHLHGPALPRPRDDRRGAIRYRRAASARRHAQIVADARPHHARGRGARPSHRRGAVRPARNVGERDRRAARGRGDLVWMARRPSRRSSICRRARATTGGPRSTTGRTIRSSCWKSSI